MINIEKKKEIVSELNKRIHDGNIKCPMCENDSFFILDGYFNTPIQDNLNGIKIGGQSIPSIAIVCKKCGFISSHALGVLNLLPKQNGENQEGGGDGK